MKTAVMTEEKLAREVEIDKVKDTVKEVYAENFRTRRRSTITKRSETNCGRS